METPDYALLREQAARAHQNILAQEQRLRDYLAKLDQATASKTAITEYKPEPSVTNPSLDEARYAEYCRTMKMFAAACDVEIQRIEMTGGVQIGNSTINEQSLCEAVVKVLKAAGKKYVSLV